jgi:signal transduction histidine kinase
MRTIRQRVTMLATLLAAGLLAVVALLMIAVMRWQLTDSLDEGLSQRADTLAAVVTGALPSELPGDEDLLIQVIAADGSVIASSANLAGRAAVVPLSTGVHTIRIAGRPETFRVLSRSVEGTDGAELVVVGSNYDHVTEPVNILLRILAIAVPVVVVVLGTLVWWLTGRTLRPVEQMRAEVAEINESNLSRRVLEPGTGDEIERLARTMNATLDRLEEAVQKQRRFVADASHELRTPLTRIQSELEVDLARTDLADRVATERSVLAEAIAMQNLVDDLLQIARNDAGAAPRTMRTIDLDDVVLREARRVGERSTVTVDATGVTAVQIVGDEAQIGRAIHNVLDNAERHATSRVRVALSEGNEHVRLTVTDDGAGIAPDEREHVFDRFTRLDEARSRDTGGTGLGLAIARDIITRHGGTIALTDGAETCFVLSLPMP